MAICQSNYLINLLSACETLEKTGRGVSIGISGSSGTTDRFRFIRERVSDTEGSEGGASTSSSIDPRDLLLFLRLKINKSTWGYKQWKSSSCSEYTNPYTQLFHDMAKKKSHLICALPNSWNYGRRTGNVTPFYVRFLLEILYLEDDLSEKESSLLLADNWSWTGVMSSWRRLRSIDTEASLGISIEESSCYRKINLLTM